MSSPQTFQDLALAIAKLRDLDDKGHIEKLREAIGRLRGQMVNTQRVVIRLLTLNAREEHEMQPLVTRPDYDAHMFEQTLRSLKGPSAQVFVCKNQEAILDQMLENLETNLGRLRIWARELYLILLAIERVNPDVSCAYQQGELS
jgi:hypothetical protein